MSALEVVAAVGDAAVALVAERAAAGGVVPVTVSAVRRMLLAVVAALEKKMVGFTRTVVVVIDLAVGAVVSWKHGW